MLLRSKSDIEAPPSLQQEEKLAHLNQKKAAVCLHIVGNHDSETFFDPDDLYHGWHEKLLLSVNPTWHALHCENPRKFGQTQVQQLRPIKLIYALA